MISIEIIVRGKVQGVWFRKYTQEYAMEHGLTGWVKNEQNGTVRIVAVGNSTSIDAFVKWCWKGSPKSHVESVDFSEIEDSDLHDSFEIIL